MGSESDATAQVKKVSVKDELAGEIKGWKNFVDGVIDRYQGERRWLINMLFDIQSEFRYLPHFALEHLAKRLDVSLSEIYGIATFYKAFTLKPRGKHVVTVCLGTACHVRKSLAVLEEFQRALGIEPGETTNDGEFTLETVNCLGCCAKGPIVVVDGEYHGNMTPSRVRSVLKEVIRGGRDGTEKYRGAGETPALAS
ncbi:MAG: NAD(P)H-dependent oxidoreductase subunit E [Thermoplasmata archaeon]